MCRALLARGLDVSIVTTSHGLTDHNGNGNKDLSTAYTHRSISTRFFPLQWGNSFKYSHPLATWLNANVRDFDVVHIHAVFNHACLAAARACRKHGIPYVVRPLGTLDPWSMGQKPLRKKLFWRLAGKRMLHHASAVHYTTQAERDAAEGLLELDRGQVVPLGIDASDLVENDAGPKAFEIAGPYVLVLSRLHPKKGLDVLIEAFCKLRETGHFSEWRLIIAGDGEPDYVSQLKKRVTDKHASDAIIFCGWLEEPEKRSVLRCAALLALPSRQENFGLCVLEALSQAVPVLISPEVNLAEEVSSVGAGWISTVDKSALQHSLVDALSNEGERVRRGSAGKKLSRNFEWDKIAEKLESMYVSVVSAGRN
jgi:glycosyltransferase involved in cell wall biosynthesis